MSSLDIPNACQTSANEPVGTTSLAAASCNLSFTDKFANTTDLTVTNRVGDTRDSIAGVIVRANDSFANAGGIDQGDYEDSPTITQYNQYVVFDRSGTPTQWKAKPTTPLDYQIDFATYPNPALDNNLQQFDANSLQALNGLGLASGLDSKFAATFKDDSFGSAIENMIARRINGVSNAVVHEIENVYSVGDTEYAVTSDVTNTPLGGNLYARRIDFDYRNNSIDSVSAINSLTSPSNIYVKRSGNEIFLLTTFEDKGDDKYLSLYRMLADADGMYDMNIISAGTPNVAPLVENSGVFSGTWIMGSPPNFYTSTVNDTFTCDVPQSTRLDFFGPADDRGGVFNLTVSNGAGEIVLTKTVSTYSPTFISRTVSLLDNAPLDDYKVHGVFTGDDPLNAPSATARGWADMDPIRSYNQTLELEFLTSKVVSRSSVMTFALLVRPNGSGLSSTWVPTHNGLTGVAGNVNTKLYFDGIAQDLGTIDELTTTYQKISRMTITQTYDAYNHNDIGNTLWNGELVQVLSKDGWEVRHTMNMEQDVFVSTGYGILNPADSSNMTELKITGQEELFSRTFAADGSAVTTSSGSSSIFTGELTPGRTIVYAMHVDTLDSAISRGKTYGEGITETSLVTDRADNVCKLYYYVANGGVIPQGESISTKTRRAVGVAIFPSTGI
ncbi:hypothetical protein NVP1076O_24 [Vibrio phage 1.076.O._10N.286.51.B7]|nr:hypothetical protein NVP1076O_24 [Vibrio phage 1.076.O._10N.286.51.B7]